MWLYLVLLAATVLWCYLVTWMYVTYDRRLRAWISLRIWRRTWRRMGGTGDPPPPPDDVA